VEVFPAVAVVLGLGATRALAGGVKLLARGLRHADDPASSLWLVRGIRDIVVGVGMAALASGIAFESTGLLVFGAVFLAEELYETGVVLFILRHVEKEVSPLCSDGRCS
jgi:hypothetical protein